MVDYDIADDVARAALAPILGHAFAFPVEDAADWFLRAGHPNIRAIRKDGRVVGGLLVVPMGQYFGGRSVSTMGVAGVGIAPDARGSGAATEMMRALIREQHAAGVALSTLYPATVPLYRRAGYERAGVRREVRIDPVRCIPSGGRDAALHISKLRVSTIEREDDPEVRALYAEYAATQTGFLDRGPYVWSRVFRPRKLVPQAIAVRSQERLEGYVVAAHRTVDGGHIQTEVVVSDLVAVTRRAAERILQILSDYRSLANVVRWSGGVPDVFSLLLPERHHAIADLDHWMLRIVDVERALAARGYPKPVSASLTIEVEDDLIPENHGTFELRVESGTATVRRSARSGGEGAVAKALHMKATIRGLAALYSGYLPARTLRTAGLLEGGDETLAHADALFAGPTPSMRDMF